MASPLRPATQCLTVLLVLALAACQATPTPRAATATVSVGASPTLFVTPSPQAPTGALPIATPAPPTATPLPAHTPAPTQTLAPTDTPAAAGTVTPTVTASPLPPTPAPVLSSATISLTGWLPITVESAARLHQVDRLDFGPAARPLATATGQLAMPDAAAWLHGFTGYVAFVGGASPLWSWNVLTGRAAAFKTSGLEGIAGPDILSIAFDPGTYPAIAAGLGNGNAVLWDAASGDVLRLYEHGAAVTALAFSRDGNSLATGGIDHVIQIWNVYNGSLEGTLNGRDGIIRALAFDATGKRLASTAGDGTLILWNLETWESERTFALGADGGTFLGFSSGGETLWSDESAGRLASWDVPNAAARPPLDIGAPATAWAINADGRVLAAASGTSIEVWDFASGQLLLTLAGHTDRISGLAFSPDSLLLVSGSRDGSLRVWAVEQ